VTSVFPLVLSLEMHCSLPQQARICRHLQTVFGEKLLLPMSPSASALPSPLELAGKVIVKAKVSTRLKLGSRPEPAQPPVYFASKLIGVAIEFPLQRSRPSS
jgi:hypothetical protein